MFGVNSSESGADLKRGFYCLLAGLSDYDYKIPNKKTHLPFFIFNLSTLHTQTRCTLSRFIILLVLKIQDMRQNRFVGRWRWFCGSSRRVSPAAEASWSLPGLFFGVSVSPVDPLLAEMETHNKEKKNNSWEPADPEQQLSERQTRILPLNQTTGTPGNSDMWRWQSTYSVVKYEGVLLCVIIVWTRLQPNKGPHTL